MGNYQADSFNSNNLTQWACQLLRLHQQQDPIWRGESAPLTPEDAYRYSPIAIVPGLRFNTNINTLLASYGDGTHQRRSTCQRRPHLTLGTFSKPFLDYTQISIVGSGSPSKMDQPLRFRPSVDLGTLGIGITQQIAGPSS